MKKYILFLFLIFSLNTLTSQPQNKELGDIQMASPEAAALSKYIEIPVGTFTGSASTSIPIHNLTEGPLSLPISISYHGSGIRAAETASWAGLGWNLNAAGIISRTVLSLPDEESGGFLVTNEDYTNPAIQSQVVGGVVDGEPDLFSFSLPGGPSGKFIIDKDIHKIIQFPKTDIKITTPDNTLDEFTIITPDGTKYIFGESGTENYEGYIFVGQNIPILRENEAAKARSSSITKQRTEWNLRKIESHDGKYHIDFTYKNKFFGLLSPSSERFSRTFTNTTYNSSGPALYGLFTVSTDANFGASGEEEYLGQEDVLSEGVRTANVLKGNYQKFETKQLETIITSTTKVEFIEGTAKRKDIHGSEYTGIHTVAAEQPYHDKRALDQIKISPLNGNTTFCKIFDLSHEYFLYENNTNLNTTYTFDYRLKLNSIKEISCNGDGVLIPPYTFEYYNDPNKNYPYMPWRLTKAIDAWGFYNGIDTNNNREGKFNIPTTSLKLTYATDVVSLTKGGADRNTYEIPMRYGSLKKITFPEGGYTALDLEANTVKEILYDTTVVQRPKTIPLPANVSSCSIDNEDGDCCPDATNSLVYNFTQDYINRAVFKIDLEDIRTTPDPNSTLCNDDNGGPWDGHIDIALTPEGSNTALFPTIELNDDTETTFFINLKELYPQMIPGNYTVTIQSAFCRGVLNFWEEEYEDISYDKSVGGLRVKEKKTFDSQANLLRAKSYNYDNFSDAGFSSGLLFKIPVFGQIIASDYTITNGPYGSSTTFYARMEFSNNSVAPLTDRQGYHIGYRNIVETEANGAFTTYVHKARSMDTEIGPNLLPYPLAPYPYFYDNGAMTLSKQGTSTDTIASMLAEGMEVFEDLTTNNAVRAEIRDGGDGATFLFRNIFQYDKTGFYREFDTYKTVDGVTTRTSYAYPPISQHLQPTIINQANSDGKVYQTLLTYPHDLALSSPSENEAVYQEMVDRNMIGMPITTINKSIDGLTIVDLGGTRNEYSMFDDTGVHLGNTTTNANPYPYTFEQKEITWDTLGAYKDEGWRTLGIINAYHPNGKPAEFTRDGWQKETYEWDNVHQLITKRTFEDFEWIYKYYSGTRLVSEIIDIDKQNTNFDYDGLQRLTAVYERDSNVTKTYAYNYFDQNAIRPQNHIKSEVIFTPVAGSGLSNITTFQYFDDIGRLIQTLNQGYSPNNKDIVNVQEYDLFGRVFKQYEPFETNNASGDFVNVVPAGVASTLTEFEESPLNRPLKITPPAWYPIHTDYGRNETAITIPGTAITFAVGELNKITSIEPDGINTKTGDRSISYKDKRGRLVLAQQQNESGSESISTFYTYDDKDRPSLILPPGTDAMNTPNLIYRYFYDGYDNIIRKDLPDTEKIAYLYNTRELQVGMQDGNMHKDSIWMVTEYDVYGRPTKTGLNTGTSPATVSAVWTENFYDGFRPDNSFSSLTNPSIDIGRLTTTNNYVLKGNQVTNTFIERFYFYDDFGRIEKETGNNHRGGTLQLFMDYDYADNLVKTRRQFHLSSFNNQRDTITQTYDHRGRPIDTYHNLANGTSEHLCQKDYDVKDLLLKESLGGTMNGFLQACNYTYLPNRFLKGINETMATEDLFSLQLDYDQGNTSLGAAPQYEGNIASLTWQYKGGQVQTYGYQYDFLNRVTTANYNLNNNAYGTTYTYDARGNITNLTRNGVYNDGTNFQAQEVDNLQYTPVAGTNKIQKISDTAPCPANKVVHQTLDNTQLHAVENQLMADNAVNDNATITYQAGDNVTLMPGFHAKAGTDFLAKIEDCPQSGFETDGFVQRSSADYDYDANGNQTIDPNKGMTVLYNYHNLPYKVTFDNGNTIDWLYAGNGTKLQKQTKRLNDTTPLLTQDYFGGIEYRNDTLEALYFEVGRLFFEENVVHYEYSLKDHLNNQRVLFSDNNDNGLIEDSEVSEISSYYPFGMRHEGSDVRVNETCDYLYNGNELQSDFGLNIYDFNNRYYDPAIGRFLQIDPLAEDPSQIDKSPYAYAWNNPIRLSDPSGLAPEDIHISFRENKDSDIISVKYGSDGKLYDNKTGDEYVGDNEFILGVQESLNSLRDMGGVVDEVVTDLVEGEEVHTVSNFDFKWDGTRDERNFSYNVKSRDRDNKRGSLTKFLPSINRIRTMNDKTTDEVILGHELKHAYNRKYNKKHYGATETGVRWEEVDATNFENIIRKAQGNGPRTIYGGKDMSNYLVSPTIYYNLRKKRKK